MCEPTPSWDVPEPDVSHLVTEDHTPAENWFQEKQMKLLTETLDVSWPEGRPFVSGADVGVFFAVKEAIVPDVLLSLGVDYPEDYHEKNRRSYFTWVFGKSPDVVIEIVSNREEGEDTSKLATYAEIHVPYYVIHDPFHLLSQRTLRIFQLSGRSYVEKVDRYLPDVGLGLTLLEADYDGLKGIWLRWTDRDGKVLQTGRERSNEAELRADEQHGPTSSKSGRKSSRRAVERWLRSCSSSAWTRTRSARPGSLSRGQQKRGGKEQHSRTAGCMGSLFKSSPRPNLQLSGKFSATLTGFPELCRKLSVGLQPLSEAGCRGAALELLAALLWMDTFGDPPPQAVVGDSLAHCLSSLAVAPALRAALQDAAAVKGPRREFPDPTTASLYSHLMFRLGDLDSGVATASRQRPAGMDPTLVLVKGLQTSCERRLGDLSGEQKAVLAHLLLDQVYNRLGI